MGKAPPVAVGRRDSPPRCCRRMDTESCGDRGWLNAAEDGGDEAW